MVQVIVPAREGRAVRVAAGERIVIATPEGRQAADFSRIKWVEDRTFIGESGSGHKLVLGTALGSESRTPGPSPIELVLIGTGGCSAFDVVHILEKGREAIEECVVEFDGERAEQDPKVFTRIHMHFVVKGRGLASSKVERAVGLSVEKYCSASAMLAKTATITHDFEVIDTRSS